MRVERHLLTDQTHLVQLYSIRLQFAKLFEHDVK